MVHVKPHMSLPPYKSGRPVRNTKSRGLDGASHALIYDGP